MIVTMVMLMRVVGLMRVIVVGLMRVVMIFMLGVGRVAHVLVPPSDTAGRADGSAQHRTICT